MNTPTESSTRLPGRWLLVARLAWLLFTLTCLLSTLSFVFLALSWATPVPDTWGFRGDAMLLALAFGGIGLLLARRQPQNPIGWLLLVAGFINSILEFCVEYATSALLTKSGALPYGTLAAWAASWIWVTAIGLLIYSFLLFPTGHLPSKHWRLVAWFFVGAFGLMTFVFMIRPGPLYFAPYLDNPFAVQVVYRVLSPIPIATAAAVLLVGISVILRLRRAEGVERQQLKWFAYAATLWVIFGISESLSGALGPEGTNPKFFQYLSVAIWIAIAVAIAFAILRYRLWDIDILINRTLVYGALTASVVSLYILIVGGFGILFQMKNNLPSIVIAILLIAFIFRPLRLRIQRVVNRVTFGGRDFPGPKQEIEESLPESRMPLRQRWLVWPLFGLTCALSALGLVFLALNGPVSASEPLRGAWAIIALVYGGIGQYLARKRPENAVAWLFLLFGLFSSATGFAGEYAYYVLVVHPGVLPGGVVAAWIASWLFHSQPDVALFIVLLFPTGHLPSARWRPLAWVTAGVLALMMLLQMLKPGPLHFSSYLDNPIAVAGSAEELSLISWVASVTVVVCMLAVVAGLIVRLRHARGVERQQLKWFAYAAALLWIVGMLQWVPDAFNLAVPGWWSLFDFLLPVFIAALPFPVGLAILRYRLWDIDLMINRTLVYGALTAGIITLYIFLVGALSIVSQTSGNLLISLLATGLIAFLFQPLRERVQHGVNRLLYGERDDPAIVLTRLAQQMGTTDTPSDILPNLVQTIAHTLKIPHVAIWLPNGETQFEPAAMWGEAPGHVEMIHLTYHRETIGRLVVAPRGPHESFNRSEQQLLYTIAALTANTVRAVQLSDELRRSRRRLVTAREDERRRLRRDLHDGLGPQLASQTLSLEAVAQLMPSNPEKAQVLLSSLKLQAQEAMLDVRRLVYDLRPPALDDLGLIGALQQSVSRYATGALRFDFDVPPTWPDLPAAVETAAYRIAQEAMTNVVRHAGATLCTVRLTCADAQLIVEVRDNGRGLSQDRTCGVGLQAMKERATELNGQFMLESLPDGGTLVQARLPLEVQDE